MPRWTRPGTTVTLAVALAASAVVPLVGAGASQAAAATVVVRITGPDVSSHQHDGGNTVNWPAVAAAGNSFAFVKATEGLSYTNPYYASDISQARAAGLIVGAYHFARPRLPLSTAAADAKKFIKVAGNMRTAKTLPPILDIESADSLSVKNRIAWATSFLMTTKKLTGRTPMIYSYGSYLSNQLGDAKSLGIYPLWYANYPRTYSSTTPTPTVLPGGWNAVTFWQYTSSARVSGFSDKTIDMSRFNGSAASLLRLADGTKAAPIAPGAPTSLTTSVTWPDATVRWSPPTSTGGSPITNYVVTVDGSEPISTPTQAYVAGLLSVGNHTIAVRAVTISGTGPPASVTVTLTAPTSGTVIAPPAATTLTLSTATTVSRSAPTPVAATLRRADTQQVIPNQIVSITVTPKAGKRQSIQLYTDPAGVISTTMIHSANSVMVATFLGTSRLTTTKATVALLVLPKPTATLTTTSVKHGVTTYLKGNTSKLYAGETVERQAYYRGAWRVWATAKVRSTGTYSFTIKTTFKATYRYRVHINASKLHLAGNSPSVRLRIR